jgi:HK97 family phage portal protein
MKLKWPWRKAEKGLSRGRFFSFSIGNQVTPIAGAAELETFVTHPWIKRAVLAIANAVASVPWKVVNGEGKEIGDSRWVKVLNTPSDDQSYFDLMLATVIYLEVLGEAFWEKVPPRMGAGAAALYNMRPDLLSLVISEDGRFIEKIVYESPSGRKATFTPEEVVHFKHFHPYQEWRGLSSLSDLDVTVRQEISANEWLSFFLSRRGTGEGYLTTDKPVGEPEIDRAHARWNARRKGETAFLPFNLSWKDMAKGPGPREGNLLGALDWLRELELMGVPPVIIGLYENAKYANMDIQLRAFYTLLIRPRLEIVKGAINRGLMKEANLTFTFDEAFIPFIDIVSAASALSTYEKLGVITPNEIIKLVGIGKEYHPDGDKHAGPEGQSAAGSAGGKPVPAA